MTNFEASLTSAQEVSEEKPIDYGYILDTFGLGPHEASATITFGNYTGTVAAMLLDERCPVGGIVAEAYGDGTTGIAGVETKLEALKTLYGNFDLKIGDETRSYHQGTTDRNDLLAKPAPQEEPPDFLAQ